MSLAQNTQNETSTIVVFLSALFKPDDHVSIRLIETWDGPNAKPSRRTRVDQEYCDTLRRLLDRDGLQLALIKNRADAVKANMHFGVCPRQGISGNPWSYPDGGTLALATHIAVVRGIWADLDHTTPEEALARCAAAGLPPPSCVIRSGSGVHLYWLLDQPVVIPASQNRVFSKKDEKGKRVKFYVSENGKLVTGVPPMSDLGNDIQRIVGGVAKKIGGDSTHDLARLLRVPGTQNYKNARNGAAPKPCEIDSIDASLAYPLSIFEPFALPEVALKTKTVGLKGALAGPMTGELKPLSADLKPLSKEIDDCRNAPPGNRSDADWRLCKEAARLRIDPEMLWPEVEDISKFAEMGESYFQRTFEKAATAVQHEEDEWEDEFGEEMAAVERQVQADMAADTFVGDVNSPPISDTLDAGDKRRVSLVKLAQKLVTLWRTPDHIGYAALPTGANVVVKSTAMRRFLAGVYLDATGHGPGTRVLEDAVFTLDAIAVNRGEVVRVHYRVARLDDRIEIDLGDDTHDAIVITAAGWRLERPTARFRRSDNMAPLPRPTRGGSIELLRPLVNVAEDQFPLVAGSILDALKGNGGYLVTILSGLQGAAKSTVARVIRWLVDPVHKADLRAFPGSEEAFVIDGESNALQVWDNLSHLSQDRSDWVCRAATGGGMVARVFYTNGEQHVSAVCRPNVLTGITDFATFPDLLSRAVLVRCEKIPEHRRLTDGQIKGKFDAVAPAILGAVCDALVFGVRDCAKTVLPRLPRMAESALWIAACVPAWGWNYKMWEHPYQSCQEDAHTLAVDASPVATALLSWWKQFLKGGKAVWEGTASELDEMLTLYNPDAKNWPTSTNHLSNRLKRDTPALEQRGIQLEFTRKKAGRFIRITGVNSSDTVAGDASGDAVDDQMTIQRQPLNGSYTRTCDAGDGGDDHSPSLHSKKERGSTPLAPRVGAVRKGSVGVSELEMIVTTVTPTQYPSANP